MSLSKLREALESHPTTSPTPSQMAHGCIPSTAPSLQTVDPSTTLYSQPASSQAVVEDLDLDLDLLHGPNPTDYPRTSANVGA